MKKFYLMVACVAASLQANAVDYLIETGKAGDPTWSAATVAELQGSNSALVVVNLSTDGAALPQSGEMWFTGGTYELANTFAITNGAKLYGGFQGTETTVDARSAAASGKAYEWENATVLEMTAVAKMFPDNIANVQLDGLTIKGAVSTANGGAILVGNNAVIKGCKFINNSASGKQGGAVMAYNKNVQIEDCYFEGNSANVGGALYVAAGNGQYGKYTMVVRHNVFVSNSATATGGALQIQGSCPIWVEGNIFYNNTAKGHGAAIYDNGAQISRIINNVVYNNSYKGTNKTVCYIKPYLFANNTICNNMGNTYFATNTDSAKVVNNVIWGNMQDEVATGCSFAKKASGGLTALNNYCTTAIAADSVFGLTVTEDPNGNNTNVQWASNTENDSIINGEDTVYGPRFVLPTTFVGAVENSAADAEARVQEMAAAEWKLRDNSILCGAGTDVAEVTEDIEGKAREAGKYDVGAYVAPEKNEDTPDVPSSVEKAKNEAIDIHAALQQGKVYTVMGVRVNSVVDGGIYIVDGKKVMMY